MEVFTGDKRNETSRISGVICDRRCEKERLAVRPGVMYGLKTVTLTKTQGAELEVAE